nr:MAG TPA: hypothetical protein [Crassvirales sp.]
MNTFQYQSRNYTPRVDLATLGKSIDTLEQGHKEAIKTASALETAVANLDMNEAEDGFKQQLVGEIQNTIKENTLFGNSYGALDDLIMKQGNIASDGRVIGRLRSNAAKKEYDAKVDAMAIPDGMKQMYKDENPYYYVDGDVDERTGKVKPGQKWEAKTNPVKTIPMAEIQKYALSIAAKDAGGGESISFLDADGKETFDPTKSADGAMYRKVGTKYERLTKDKIDKAMQVAIQSIPGAEDSLRQDYKYGLYQLDNQRKDLVKAGKKENPYMEGFTDKNGNIYTYNQWLSNSINGFKDVAAYNHVWTSIDFGTALQNRRAMQAQQAAAAAAQGNTPGVGEVVVGTTETDTDAYKMAVDAKAAANKTGLGIIHKLDSKFGKMNSISDVIGHLINNKLAYGPNTTISYLLNTYGKKLSQADKINLSHAIMGYYQANKQYKQMVTVAGTDSDALEFSAQAKNAEFSNNNKYGKKLIHSLNAFYKHNDYAQFTVGENVMANFYKRFGVNNDSELRQLGIDVSKNSDGTWDIKVDAAHRNLLPKVTSDLYAADKATESTVWAGLKKKFGFASATNFIDHQFGASIGDTPGTYRTVTKAIVNQYNDAMEKAAAVEKRIGIIKTPYSIKAYDTGSYGAMYYRTNAAALGLDPIKDADKIKQLEATENNRVDEMFASGAFDSGMIQEADNANHYQKTISNAQDAKLLIQAMYSSDENRKKITRLAAKATGNVLGEPLGYYLSFTVPKNAANDTYKEGQQVRFKVSAINTEDVHFYNPNYNSDVLAGNAILISRANKVPVENLGYNNNFGSTMLTPTKSGGFQSMFMGKAKVLAPSDAEKLTANYYSLEQIKVNYQNGQYTNLNLLQNSIVKLATDIANITGKNPQQVCDACVNYLREP